MNRGRAMLLLVILAVGFALVADGRPTAAGGGFSELQRSDVSGASNLEAIMGLIERPGKSIGAKHYHPGGEFGFVLEGAVTVATEGEPEVILKAGDSFYQPPGEWHVVGTSAEGARTLVFRILEKGQPMVVAVE